MESGHGQLKGYRLFLSIRELAHLKRSLLTSYSRRRYSSPIMPSRMRPAHSMVPIPILLSTEMEIAARDGVSAAKKSHN